MSYEIKWNPRPLKFLKGLPEHEATMIWKRIGKLKDNPFRFLEHFEGKHFFKFRIGKYRALVRVDVKSKIIRIEVLDKRSRIYKKK